MKKHTNNNTTDIFADDFSSKESLISELKSEGFLSNNALEQAFRLVDRKNFVSKEYEIEAGENYSLPIGEGQSSLSPGTLAFMFELLDVRPGHRLLNVGLGSGYSTALLAVLVGPTGKVISTEVVPELSMVAEENLNRYNFPNIELLFVKGGLPSVTEPFDRVIVTAEMTDISSEILDLLEEGGIAVVAYKGSIVKIVKGADGEFDKESFEGFEFDPFKE